MVVNITVSLARARVIWEKGISVEEMLPLDWSVDKSVGAFSLLLIDVEGPSSL